MGSKGRQRIILGYVQVILTIIDHDIFTISMNLPTPARSIFFRIKKMNIFLYRNMTNDIIGHFATTRNCNQS